MARPISRLTPIDLRERAEGSTRPRRGDAASESRNIVRETGRNGWSGSCVFPRAGRRARRAAIMSQLFQLWPFVWRCRIDDRSGKRGEARIRAKRRGGATVLIAGGACRLRFRISTLRPRVAKEPGELLDVDGLARERRRIEAGQHHARGRSWPGRSRRTPDRGPRVQTERVHDRARRSARACDPCRTRRARGRGPPRQAGAARAGRHEELRMASARAVRDRPEARAARIRSSSTSAGRAPDAGGDHRQAGRHGLEHHVRAGLAQRRQDEDLALAESPLGLAGGAVQAHRVRQGPAPGSGLELGPEGAFSPDRRTRRARGPALHDGRGLDQLMQPLLADAGWRARRPTSLRRGATPAPRGAKRDEIHAVVE